MNETKKTKKEWFFIGKLIFSKKVKSKIVKIVQKCVDGETTSNKLKTYLFSFNTCVDLI